MAGLNAYWNGNEFDSTLPIKETTPRDANAKRQDRRVSGLSNGDMDSSQISHRRSMLLSEESDPHSFTGFLTDFAVNTSAHGIPRVGVSKSCGGRIIWSLVFLGCVGIFAYQAHSMIIKFNRNEKIVNIELIFEKIQFPAITLCNLNPYKHSLVSEVDVVKQSMDAFTDQIGKKKPPREAPEPDTLGADGAALLGDRVRREVPTETTTIGNRRTRKKTQKFAAVMAHCECSDEEKKVCKGDHYMEPPSNETACICTYDRQTKNIWPCYPLDIWKYDLCDNCNPRTGYCLPSNVDTLSPEELAARVPCMCQTVTNYCLQLVNGEFKKLWELMTTSTTTSSTTTTTTEDVGLIEALGFEGLTDEVAIVTKAKENLVFSMAALTLEQRISYSYSREDLVKKCSFNGAQCNMTRAFQIHVDARFGNCWTFNYDASHNSTKAGPTYGLRVVMYVDVDDYLPTTESSGIRLQVHDQAEIPFPDTFGYSAPTGFTSSFGIRLKQVSRLSKPFGDCVKGLEDAESYIYKGSPYSPEGCFRSCNQADKIRVCGCGDPLYPVLPGDHHCPPDDPVARKCLEDMTKGVKEQSEDNCVCGQPCDQSAFSVSFSASKWPAGTSQFSDCNGTSAECLARYRKHAAMLEIFFEQLNFESFKESEAYGWVNLLADFGGQLGLWMGISVITCMEFFVLVWDLLLFFCKKCHHNRKQKEVKKTDNLRGTTNGYEKEQENMMGFQNCYEVV